MTHTKNTSKKTDEQTYEQEMTQNQCEITLTHNTREQNRFSKPTRITQNHMHAHNPAVN